jgi:SAM-dependent methyltransferase
MKLLDVGCGPGTITADLAALLPQGHVIGLEYAPEVLKQARETADKNGVTNVEFAVGDVHALKYADGTFDIVHAHQVLQHVGDPVQALREMKRVTKSGGIVAVRDSDFGGFIWYPEVPGMDEYFDLYRLVARSNGGEPCAGRRLHAWAREAGFDTAQITATAGTWCYYTPEERFWWSELWADRTVGSAFATSAIEKGHATKEDLEMHASTWRKWGEKEDGWFTLIHGEIIAPV